MILLMTCPLINWMSLKGLLACWLNLHVFGPLQFFNKYFKKQNNQNDIILLNSLDPDQARYYVGPDLGGAKLFARIIRWRGVGGGGA